MISYKPKVRGAFSDRNKIETINTIIQKDDLDSRTRNGIVNLVDFLIETLEHKHSLDNFYEYIYKVIFCLTSDEMPYYPSERREHIVDGIKTEWEYHEIFSFLEAILKWYKEKYYDDSIYTIFNSLFEKECVGYRFINGEITDIISKEEIDEVEEALNTKYNACNKCISKALSHLYDREKPDYSNSVKESISAIEAMCNIILESKNSTLGEAANQLEENGWKIHGAMKKAYSSLYGYTSDKSGIRHNHGIDENTTFEEAKYMLVSCSAFLNYLIQIYEKQRKE